MADGGARDLRKDGVTGKAREQIDRNMKLAFQETLEEPLPEKLSQLIEALKRKERDS